MRCFVWEGWVEEIRGSEFTARFHRNDETIFATFWKRELPAEEARYLAEGAGLTWYVTERGCALRFCKRRITRSQIRRAERQAREWMELFAP